MKVPILSGKYVVAVSGGVDSAVLLDILAKQVTDNRLQVTDKRKKNSNLQPTTYNLELVVAHFDHGIRKDSSSDEKLVADLASKYDLAYVSGNAKLGPNASEETARDARYKFLLDVRKRYRAKSIITAHHQDDLIETALINVIRGTKRQGLSAISANPNVIRPLLNYPKQSILEYALKKGLVWREDPTNSDTDYLRNYLRQNYLANLNSIQRSKFLKTLDKVAKTNLEINKRIATLSHSLGLNIINRAMFCNLPNDVGREVILYLMKRQGITDYDAKTIGRLNNALRTAKPNTVHAVKGPAYLKVTNLSASFITP